MASPRPRRNPQIPILLVNYRWYQPPPFPRLCCMLLMIAVALILNMANVLAFTRCDKDQKRKWATGAAVGALSGGTGGIAGRLAGVVMGRFFR
jgi:hypothetical protein